MEAVTTGAGRAADLIRRNVGMNLPPDHVEVELAELGERIRRRRFRRSLLIGIGIGAGAGVIALAVAGSGGSRARAPERRPTGSVVVERGAVSLPGSPTR